MPDNYFVIDTNVVVSVAVFSLLTPTLSIKRILSLGKLVFSLETLQEYADTLSSNKFDKYVPIEKRIIFLQKLINEGSLITVTRQIKVCRDPKDDKYLELAVACNASCIITGDKDLLVLNPFDNIPILTPADFLNQY
jgi:putative PIN family toxin of toxin-antitoxin system